MVGRWTHQVGLLGLLALALVVAGLYRTPARDTVEVQSQTFHSEALTRAPIAAGKRLKMVVQSDGPGASGWQPVIAPPLVSLPRVVRGVSEVRTEPVVECPARVAARRPAARDPPAG
ncbi:MAG: hypothetical protein ACTHU0_30750 [Kofleriaceae bacterium]